MHATIVDMDEELYLLLCAAYDVGMLQWCLEDLVNDTPGKRRCEYLTEGVRTFLARRGYTPVAKPDGMGYDWVFAYPPINPGAKELNGTDT